MSNALFIELWTGIRDLMHDNKTPEAVSDAKRFINWTMYDLANEYDWEFLRGSYNLTATGGSTSYSLEPIAQLSATAETLFAQSDATADGGSVITIYGKQIGASSQLNISTDPITLIATATATGGISYSQIDSVRRATGSGTVTITTSTGGVVATLGASETYVSNDMNKINVITDTSNQNRIHPWNRGTFEKGNPNSSNLGNAEGYEIDHLGNIQFYNVDVDTRLTIYYQRIPRYLVNDADRTEFPSIYNQKIINAAYEGYGLRFKDETDANLGKARYKALLGEIVEAWVSGKDRPVARVMPGWFIRRL